MFASCAKATATRLIVGSVRVIALRSIWYSYASYSVGRRVLRTLQGFIVYLRHHSGVEEPYS